MLTLHKYKMSNKCFLFLTISQKQTPEIITIRLCIYVCYIYRCIRISHINGIV